MEHNNKSPYASEPFKFVIDGNPLYIHADLVTLHSKPLDRLINGHMIEAQKKFAVIEDVNEETFTRFVQWAYNGYYSPANFEMMVESASPVHNDEVTVTESPVPPVPAEEQYLPEDPIVEVTVIEEGTGWGESSKKVSKKKKGTKIASYEWGFGPTSKETLKTSFIQRKTVVRQESIPIPPPRANQDPHENYTSVFLSHARLYVFADKYDVQPLRNLALDNLHQTLAIFTLYEERTGDIVELLHYVYANSGESVQGREDIRTLMTEYVGIEMEVLMKDEGFKELMIEDGGALLGDFMGMVAKRI